MRIHKTGFYFLSVMLMTGILGCSQRNPRVATALNQNASLQGDLPFNPVQGRVITTWINRSDSTMSILFGNDLAVNYARTNSSNDYPSGTVLALVTWRQQEDKRWFGGNIPDTVRSIEYVFVKTASDQKKLYSYQEYEGSPLKQVSVQESPLPKDRAAYLLLQRAAVMP